MRTPYEHHKSSKTGGGDSRRLDRTKKGGVRTIVAHREHYNNSWLWTILIRIGPRKFWKLLRRS